MYKNVNMFYFQNKLNGCLKFQLQNELRGNKRQGQYFKKNLEDLWNSNEAV